VVVVVTSVFVVCNEVKWIGLETITLANFVIFGPSASWRTVGAVDVNIRAADVRVQRRRVARKKNIYVNNSRVAADTDSIRNEINRFDCPALPEGGEEDCVRQIEEKENDCQYFHYMLLLLLLLLMKLVGGLQVLLLTLTLTLVIISDEVA